MENIDYVKQKLADNKSNFKEIAFKANVTDRTLHNVLTGAHAPSAKTLAKLKSYFKRREGK